jgi:hypothetical protein
MFGVLYRQTGCFYRDPYPRFMQVSHPDPVRQRRSLNAGEIRTLGLASLGGALEFYDFVVFVFFTAVIGQLFFPPSLPDWLRQLQTFGIFAAGYLARPLGGIGPNPLAETNRNEHTCHSIISSSLKSFHILG